MALKLKEATEEKPFLSSTRSWVALEQSTRIIPGYESSSTWIEIEDHNTAKKDFWFANSFFLNSKESDRFHRCTYIKGEGRCHIKRGLIPFLEYELTWIFDRSKNRRKNAGTTTESTQRVGNDSAGVRYPIEFSLPWIPSLRSSHVFPFRW